MKISAKNLLFLALLACCTLLPCMTPPVALLLGIVFALTLGSAFAKPVKKAQKYLLQASVVGLGFGMNFVTALSAGKDGMLLTIASVAFVMLLGWVVGRVLRVEHRTSYLVSTGTAICGGSAIAAVGPLVDADDHQMTVSLGTIFLLNALALFLFPPLGHALGMDQTQFGQWAAIAIHDTSSVVGAGAAYDQMYYPNSGNTAFEVATLVKCTRALWIFPLAFVTMLLWKQNKKGVAIPWFIVLFAGAMLVNTYAGLPEDLTKSLVFLAKRGIIITLFLIGTGLSRDAFKKCGFRPILQGLLLWAAIAVVSALCIL